MSNITVRKRRGTTLQLSTLVGSPGEVFIDLTKPTLIVHNGTTPGGIPLAQQVHTHANATETVSGFFGSTDKVKLDALSLAGGIQTVLSNTVPVTSRATVNFTTDFSVTDNPGATRTEFAISQGFRNEMNGDVVAFILALN